jgi:hypothetical protein
MNAAAAKTLSSGKARDQLRSEHQVQLISPDDEGSAFDRIPNGVYGFTYAPGTETPVFRGQSYHSFEVHKRPDGSGFLVAHCTPEDLAALKRGGRTVEITAYPDPWEKATEAVAIPIGAVVSGYYKPVRQDGNGIPLRLSL